MNRSLCLLLFLALACDEARTGTGGQPRSGATPDAGFAASADGGGLMDAGQQMAPDAGFPPTGLPVLGNGAHAISSVVVTSIADERHGLNVPRDLEFHPNRTNELWVISRRDHSTLIISNPGEASQSVDKRSAPGGAHFMAEPSALAFGDNGNFATIHEIAVPTQSTTPGDFMGPTMWTTNMNVFDAGHAGHLDMLHNSPNGMGIAWETGNVYWVFDGDHSALTRYDFRSDHGPGGADHSDGVVARYVEGMVRRVADVPSHMVVDHATDRLWVADTGNNRIATLDISSGRQGGTIRPNYDGSRQFAMLDATLQTVIDGTTLDLLAPSGLALHDGHVYVGDNASGIIYGFDMAGQLVDWLPVGVAAGGLMGLTFDGSGNLYFVDALTNRVQRLSPVP